VTQRIRCGGADDVTLRFALLSAWKNKCYWCKEPLSLVDAQIDHIIPRGLAAEHLARTLGDYGLPLNFDRDDVANLAPICASCNRTKSNRSPSGLGIISSHLTRAATLAPKTIAAVTSIREEPVLAEHMIRVSTSDLGDQRIKTLMQEAGPAVMRTLIAAGVPTVVSQRVRLTLDPNRGEDQLVDLVLDDDGVAARRVIEEICGSTWDDYLTGVVRVLLDEVVNAVQQAVEGLEDDTYEPINAGPPVMDAAITVDQVRFEWQHDSILFTARGEIHSGFSCSAVRYAEDGSGLLELQGDGEILSQFSVHSSHSMTCYGDPVEADWVQLDTDGIDAWLE
jgi:hypothetical protein